MPGPGNILITIGAKAGQAVSELGTVNKALGHTMTTSEKMSAGLKKAAIPAAAALTGIAYGAKKAIDAASNLNEQMNKSQTVFGDSGAEVIRWSKTLSKSFGLSSRAALEAAGTFGNMLVPMGFTRKEAAGMSKQMVELAGDMASFNNASPEETLAAISSGLAGQSEPLRKYGVFLTETRVKAEALALGLVKTTVSAGDLAKAQASVSKAHADQAKALKEHGAASAEYEKAQAQVLYSEEKVKKVMDGKLPTLTAAQKAQATYSLMLKDTADAQGDFTKTSDSAANQTRIQAAQTENLSAELGQALLPAYTAIQRILIRVIDVLSRHTGAVKLAVGAIAALSAGILIANAAMKAYAAVGVIVKVATAAWTAAQWLLNAALSANPIGLVIVAVAALAAGLVIAYQKSETFRKIVTAAFDAVKKAIDAVKNGFNVLLDAATKAFNWIVGHWKLALFAFGPIGAAVYAIVQNFDKVKTAASAAFEFVKGAWNVAKFAFGPITAAVEAVAGAFNAIAAAAKAAIGAVQDLIRWVGKVTAGPIDAVTRAIASAIGAVRDLIDWIGKIKVPKIHLPGKKSLMVFAPSGPAPAATAAAASAGPLTINVYGAVDPEGTARAIRRLLLQHDRRQGRVV